MSGRRSIVFTGEGGALAHVVRPLVLAACLDPAEYDVSIAADECYRALIESHPQIRFRPLASLPPSEFLHRAHQGYSVLQPGDLERYVQDELAVYDDLRPDLVVSDYRPSVAISAKLRGIPSAALTNVYWSPYRRLGFAPGTTAPTLVQRLRRQMRRRPPIASTTRCFNVVSRNHGLPGATDYLDLLTRGDYTLYADPEGLLPTRALPASHHFLGAVLWSPDVPRPAWWETWNTALPLIYVTMGTTGAVRLVPGLIDALARLPATVVVATAGRLRKPHPPANAYIADYLPGLELCARASVVVCNGGSTTAYQAIQQGVPVVGVWDNRDQYMSVMTLAERGAALAVRAAGARVADLTDAVRRLIADPAFRRAAEQTGRLFRSCDARARFRRLVPLMLSGVRSDECPAAHQAPC